MTALLSMIPIPWRVAGLAIVGIVFAATFGLGFWKGHSSGYESAANKYRAQIAELQADYNKRAAEAAQRFQAELEQKTQAAMSASEQYHKEREAHESSRIALQQRIDSVTRNSTHRFSTEFVRVWNEATGAVAAGSDAAESANPTGVSAGAGAGKASGARISGGQVTESDVLRYLAYYGKRARDMEAQLRGLIRIVQE